MSLNYFQKLPWDAANIPSVSSELTGWETVKVSKELKKVQDKGKNCVWTTSWNRRTRFEKWKCVHTPITFLKVSTFDEANCFRFKKAYLESKRNGVDVNSEGIVMKNRCRPTASRGHYEKTIDTVSAFWLRGTPVTSSVINAVAKGIVQANDLGIARWKWRLFVLIQWLGEKGVISNGHHWPEDDTMYCYHRQSSSGASTFVLLQKSS